VTAVFVRRRAAVLKDGSDRRLGADYRGCTASSPASSSGVSANGTARQRLDMECLGTHLSNAGSIRQASGGSEQRTGLIGRWRSVSCKVSYTVLPGCDAFRVLSPC